MSWEILRTIARALLVATCVALWVPAAAAEEKAPVQEGQTGKAQPEAKSVTRVAGGTPIAIYVPPKGRGSATRRSGGGTRYGLDLPEIEILAPKGHEGLTREAQPEFFWALSDETDVRIDFTLIDDHSIEPLVEVQLDAGGGAGVHAVALSDFGAELLPERRYVWFVTLVPDPARRSADVIWGAPIRRLEPAATADAEAAGMAGFQSLAQDGYWYDAVAAAHREDSPEVLAGLVGMLDGEELPLSATLERRRSAGGSRAGGASRISATPPDLLP